MDNKEFAQIIIKAVEEIQLQYKNYRPIRAINKQI